MQVTLVQCSPRLMGKKLQIIQVIFLSGINGSKEAHTLTSQMKTMLTTFFDIKCIVHFKFIPQGQTVKQAYVEIL
jgi:hypothetical protein